MHHDRAGGFGVSFVFCRSLEVFYFYGQTHDQFCIFECYHRNNPGSVEPVRFLFQTRMSRQVENQLKIKYQSNSFRLRSLSESYGSIDRRTDETNRSLRVRNEHFGSVSSPDSRTDSSLQSNQTYKTTLYIQMYKNIKYNKIRSNENELSEPDCFFVVFSRFGDIVNALTNLKMYFSKSH